MQHYLRLSIPITLLVSGWLGGCSQQNSFTATTPQTSDVPLTQVRGQEENIVLPEEEVVIETLAPGPEDAEPGEISDEGVQTEEKPTLTVILPSHDMRIGSAPMQVTSKLSTQVEAPDVRYVLSGPAGIELGTINAAGLYTTPSQAAAEFELTITSIWLKDETVQGSDKLKVIPASQIFVACVKDSVSFPITADVYTLPVNTSVLPDFAQIPNAKVAKVCMDQYNIATRDWTAGFPGVANLFEWFGLQTKATLIVPTTGSYTLRLTSDDGSKLYIDQQLLINNDGTHSTKALEATVQMTAGEHELKLDYFQGPRTQIALELFWKVPGSASFVYVPKAAFK